MAAHIGSATTAVRRNLANGLNSVLSWTPLNARIGGEDGVGGEGAPRLCCRQGVFARDSLLTRHACRSACASTAQAG